MKANELMIGDWVLCEGTPLKLNVGQLYNLAFDTKWAERYPCEPIPITEEILKANGFGKPNRCYWHETVYSGKKIMLYDFMLQVYDSDNFAANCIAEARPIEGINYVHELQHALRLCGLEELADNFKIHS